ncbi:hypothetical protein [Cupriavidus metallidurans]|uniref:Uncharacterized protein n=1 Tax=Cupriavidus metallidurans (strain ATCC 43123 / DSM 2839 / NBRC 102507 / CH34) TaxID=266264 RepID=Q1LQ44_CUPMC|nr:hypothetical protein [Cupriavidus metallidurans]ABF07732.1 hypothetical protein Rmet_0846 [Cupriavidus metallidurans CH34]QGS27966.1 hypothetical protein FOB83_03250 [Cupriavidus metallidurans]
MRARVSLTTLRRLDRVELARSVNRPRGEWPPTMGVDEWEAKATEYLARLCGQEDLPAPPPVANHNDVTHRYKPSAFMHGIEVGGK